MTVPFEHLIVYGVSGYLKNKFLSTVLVGAIVGVVKVWQYRPFPTRELATVLSKVKKK